MDMFASIDFGSTIKLFMDGGSFLGIIGLALFVWKALPRMIDRIVDGKMAKDTEDHKVLGDVYAMLKGLEDTLATVKKRVTHHIGTSDHVSLRQAALKSYDQISDIHSGVCGGELDGVWDKLVTLQTHLDQVPDNKQFSKLSESVKRTGLKARDLIDSSERTIRMIEGIPNRTEGQLRMAWDEAKRKAMPSAASVGRHRDLQRILDEALRIKEENGPLLVNNNTIDLTYEGRRVTLSAEHITVEVEG